MVGVDGDVMFLRSCRKIDEISVIVSDPVILTSILLAKNRKFIKSASIASSEVPDAVAKISKSASSSSVLHYRFSIGGAIYRIFTVRDIAVAAILENGAGQGVKYGSDVLVDFFNILGTNIAIDMYVEEIPLEGLNEAFAGNAKICLDEAEKPFVSLWRKKGVYWFAVEELISDKGSYAYIFRVRDADGNVCVLKVLKDDVAVNRNFMDIMRGYLHSFAISTLDEREFQELVELKGYNRDELKDLLAYSDFVASVKALLILKNKLDRESYIRYPPAVVEEYAALGDLEAYVQKHGTRGFEEAMYIIIRIVGAVALAHMMNIVHLDIKPRNILLFQSDKSKFGYTPKITDFSGALGDPVHGYRLTRLTPGYADPLALLRGVSDLSYDVYSLAMVLAYIVSGSIPKHRLILNIALLQSIYGYPIPMEKIGEDEKPLNDFAKKVIDLSLQLKSKTISYQDFVKAVEEDVESLDLVYMPWMSDIPRPVAEVAKKALVLKLDDRYKSCVDMWLELKKALIKEKMEHLLPS